MPTILVIDDDPVFLSNVAQLLEFEDYNVIVSLDGQEAIQTALTRPIDLILCDRVMQPMNGLDILGAIRNQPETAQIPFVFVTGLKGEATDVEEHGISGYLVKPFTNDVLLATVREHLVA